MYQYEQRRMDVSVRTERDRWRGGVNRDGLVRVKKERETDREGDGNRQGRRWKQTGREMETDREGDGNRQGGRWKQTGRGWHCQ